MEWFRGGLVIKDHRLLHHSTRGLRVVKKKKKLGRCVRKSPARRVFVGTTDSPASGLTTFKPLTLAEDLRRSCSHAESHGDPYQGEAGLVN